MPDACGQPPVLNASEAVDLLGGGLDLESTGALAGRPLVAVTLEGAWPRTLATITAHLPCVVVGVAEHLTGAEAPQGFDVLLTSERAPDAPWVGCADVWASLRELSDAIAASPRASVSLVQLLRYTSALDLPDAVVAESFTYSMLQAGPRFTQWLQGHRPRRPTLPCPAPVLTERTPSSLEICLNRPEARNAVDASTRDALIEALQVAVADPSIATVRLKGAGPDFCAGGDLTEFGLAPDPATAHLVRVNRSVALWLLRCASRVTAEVHGACIGAGAELAAFAHRVEAAPDTYFALPEVGMGLIPGAGGTASLTRRMGPQRAAYLALSGTRLEARTAQAWGLVDHIAHEHPQGQTSL